MKIRHLLADDIPEVARWAEQDECVVRAFGAKDIDGFQATLAMMAQRQGMGASRLMAVEGTKGSLMGLLVADNIMGDMALVHALVAPEFRGRGYWIIKTGIKYAQEILGLNTLVATVPHGETFETARRLNQKIGFQKMDADVMILQGG